MTFPINRTPEHMRCAIGTCPSVTEDGDNVIIVGRVTDVDEYPWLAGKVGEHEEAIVIDRALLSDLFQTQRPLATELSGHQDTGQSVWFEHEVYFSGIRFDPGEYRLIRVGNERSDPEF